MLLLFSLKVYISENESSISVDISISKFIATWLNIAKIERDAGETVKTKTCIPLLDIDSI